MARRKVKTLRARDHGSESNHTPAPMSKDLELALRIRADLQQGQAELQQFADTLAETGAAADAASDNLGKVGETANQQTDRIRAMVEASLAQANAQQQMRDSLTELTQTQSRAAENWRDTAAAQTASMEAYWQTELALERQAAAEQRAAEEAAKATAEAGKQEQALRRLLGQLNSTEKALAQLDQQERELAEHFRAGRLDAEAYGRALDEIRNRRNALQGISDDARKANLEVNNLTRSIRRAYGVIATGVAGFGAVSFSRAIVNTNLEWQQALNTMEAATGSAGAARQELEFVRETSERLGLELLSTAQSYSRLVAAAKETPTLQPFLHEIFEGVGSAATVLSLTREETSSLMLALEQMVSKGRVQTQELVLQLGQRVPGAFALAAKALNTNTQQLTEWLEKGQIAADEFLPRFGRALRDAYGDRAQSAAAGLQGELNRLSNAWTELKVGMGEAGFIDSVVVAIRDLRDLLKDPAVRDGFNTLAQGMGKVITVSAGFVSGVAGFTRMVSEDIAARVHGPAADDVVRLEKAIDRANASIDHQQRIYDTAVRRQDQRMQDAALQRVTELQLQVERWKQNLDAIYNASRPAAASSEQAPQELPQFTPGAGRSRGGMSEAERLAKQNQDWVKQLEKEAATFGKGKAALREYELEQRQLSGTLRDRALAAWEALDAAEKQRDADRQAARDTQLLAQLQLDYLKATGQAVEAAEAEIEKKYGALRERLLARGEADQASLVDQLIGVEKAQAQLADLERQIDRLFAEQARREQSIQTQIQAGLITETEARRQIVDLHQRTADEVETLLPRMRELAELTGDPDAIERLKDMQARLESMRIDVNEFVLALRDGLQGGLEDAIMGLVRGTHDLRDALDSLVLGIAESMARLASQQLAEMATQGIMGLFQQTAQAATAAAGQKAAAEVAAINTVTAAQQAADTARAASSVAAANTAAAGQAGAAASTASAWTPAAIAASIGSFGSAAAIGLAAVVAAMAFKAFAGGGDVWGPGTGTSDSIPSLLSNGEFVTRAAVMAQPGAREFQHDFNARGMVALDDWASRVRHATGGLAGVPAPALPAPAMHTGQLTEGGGNQTMLKNNIDVFVGVPEQFIVEQTWGRAGKERFYAELSQNAATVRQILGFS